MVRARYLKPQATSYDCRSVELRVKPDAQVAGAYLLEAFTDLGPSPTNASDPWVHLGLFDSHLHVTWLGETERRVMAERFADLESYVAALKSEMAQKPVEEVLLSYGFDEDRWGLRKEDLFGLVGAQLDPSRKWILFRVCGHCACASPALLKSLGVVTPKQLLDDPEIHEIQSRLPPTPRATLKQDFLRAQEKLLAAGIDTVGDMSLDENLIEAILELRKEGRLNLDYQGVMIDETTRGGYLKAPLLDDDQGTHFTIRHWKRYLDGSFGSRTAWLREAYADDSNTHGLRLYETAELIESARKVLKQGFALSFHAIGDAALEQLLEMSDALRDEMRTLNDRVGFKIHRIEHAQMMGDDQLRRLQSLGLWTLCLQPSHRDADLSFIKRRLGAERFQKDAYRLKSLIDAGLPVSLGSDAPITFYDPQKTLSACDSIAFKEALWRYSEGGRLLHGLPARELAPGVRVWILKHHAAP